MSTITAVKIADAIAAALDASDDLSADQPVPWGACRNADMTVHETGTGDTWTVRVFKSPDDITKEA